MLLGISVFFLVRGRCVFAQHVNATVEDYILESTERPEDRPHPNHLNAADQAGRVRGLDLAPRPIYPSCIGDPVSQGRAQPLKPGTRYAKSPARNSSPS